MYYAIAMVGGAALGTLIAITGYGGTKPPGLVSVPVVATTTTVVVTTTSEPPPTSTTFASRSTTSTRR